MGFSHLRAIPVVAQPESEQDQTALQEQQQRELELILPKLKILLIQLFSLLAKESFRTTSAQPEYKLQE